MTQPKNVFQCQNKECNKVILKTHPKAHFHQGREDILTMVDSNTGVPVVLPNVFCPHCKYKNLVQWNKPGLLDTSKEGLGAEIKESLKPPVVEEIEEPEVVEEDDPFDN